MAARKRTTSQRDFDLEWIVERADEGLGPRAILARAQEPVIAADFGHLPLGPERDRAIRLERARRASVGQLTDKQVGYDLRQMRRRALDAGERRYRLILERVIEELTRLGFADARQLFEWGPSGVTLRDCWDLNEAEAAVVAGVTVKTTTRTNADGAVETVVEAKVDTHSKTQALRDLLRHLGGYLTVQLPVDSEDPDEIVDRLLERLSSAEAEEPDQGAS